jgi:spore maturation protein CgeB
MRILMIAPFGHGCLAESYAHALERGGHDVLRFDSDKAYFEASWYARNRWLRRLLRRTLWNRLNLTTLKVVRAVRPSLVFALKAAYLNPETVRLVRVGEAIPFVNYYPDNPYCGVPVDPRKTSAQRRDIIDCLREYTRVFTWEKGLANCLVADRVSATYLPFGVDPDCGPQEVTLCRQCGKRHEIVFVGQYSLKRESHIDAICRHKVALWGARWARAGRRFRGRHLIHHDQVFGTSCAAVYSNARISLNILDDLNMPGHNMRTFEIPATGGVMLSTYTREQDEFFPEGEAAWYYRDPREMDDLIKRLLRDEHTLERTRCRALQIAQNHTYDHRAESLLADLRT